MNFELPNLKTDEIIALKLRVIFEKAGYTLYRMGSFESYDLYMQNKNFLSSEDIITFTGSDGRLMALKPDVTLSIVKNTKAGESRKVYYNESVFRTDRGTGEYRQINQIGLEYIGADGKASEVEVLSLAAKSLEATGEGVIDISHMGFIDAVMKQFVSEELYESAYAALRNKSSHLMREAAAGAALSEERQLKMSRLVGLSGPFEETLKIAYELTEDIPAAQKALDELDELWAVISSDELKRMLRLDFSILNDVDYYNGIIFQGFLKGIPRSVISGGRYDNLMARFNKNCGAIGFALHLDELERADSKQDEISNNANWLNIALPKGRMGEGALKLFEDAAICKPGVLEESRHSRKLVFEDETAGIRFYMVKPGDVDSYVEYGTADIGIVGRDVLLENGLDVMELTEENLGRCRLVVAGKAGFTEDTTIPLRVATKYPHITARHYAGKSQSVEIIELKGSVELAPLTGLADVIVDIVETGGTLRENNLTVLEEITDSSARVIANRAAFRFKNSEIKRVLAGLEGTL